VQVGNAAAGQEQHDVLGELLGLAWRRHLRGADPDADDWRFLAAVADRAAGVWELPDRGIWEWRGEPRHFVHSKALCWAGLDHALRLADSCGFDAPARWHEACDAIREAVDRHGVDDRGVFVQVFDADDLDAAALLLPVAGYCAWDDPRMVATADAVRDELDEGGLLRRYRIDDGQPGEEHPFTACTFWLAECLARQGRRADAERAFSAAMAVRTPLGLFSEQADPAPGGSWGNVPQALSHLSHIAAAIALNGGN
jgi:GH15 family glucan-1,4-alpha-glucosidase